MLPGPSFRSAFVSSINSLILPGPSLASFPLAEPSRFAFCGFIFLCVRLTKKYYEMSFIYDYSHF